MEQEECLVRLEKSVANLLANYNEVKQEKKILETRLLQREQDLAVLQEKVDSLKEERSVVLQRVTTLIGSIDKWEESVTVDTSNEDVVDAEGAITQEPEQQVLTLDG